MRILLILKYIPTRNSDLKSDLIWSIVDGLKDEGFDIILMTNGRKSPHNHQEIETIPSDLITFVIRMISFLLRSLGFINQSTKLNDVILIRSITSWINKNGKIDLSLALCTANHPGISAYKIYKHLGIPFIVQEHKNYENNIHNLDDIPQEYLATLKTAHALVAVSTKLKQQMLELNIRDDIKVIPNSISEDFFKNPDVIDTSISKFEQASDDYFIFGAWTRWREIKRVDLLLRAFCEVNKRNSKTKLLIAGPIEPESNKAWVDNYIQKNSLDDVVWNFGTANRKQIHQICYLIDCNVIPSDYETFGLPALEALSAGKPVITTECKGPEMLVSSDAYGRKVTKGDHNALYEAMIDVLNNYEKFDSDMIIQTMKKKYSRSSVAKQFKQLIEEVL